MLCRLGRERRLHNEGKGGKGNGYVIVGAAALSLSVFIWSRFRKINIALGGKEKFEEVITNDMTLLAYTEVTIKIRHLSCLEHNELKKSCLTLTRRPLYSWNTQKLVDI
ncbi:hypothetical protein VNO77_02935 [Canavalia gladiata]|uniref:Transmembrane protein n=1 Tax=Canavalia gladiata TaxID=3824 RepID=A0AAN9R6D2_CANGL